MTMPREETTPAEQLKDRFSRLDELIITTNGLLKSLIARLGGTTPGDGGGTPLPPVSEKATTLIVATIKFDVADKEYAWQFPPGMKTFSMHSRSGNAVRISHTQGTVTPSVEPYFTLKANTAYSQDDLNIKSIQPPPTFYFACSVATEVLEIIIGV